MSSARVDHQISLFRSQVELRRFDDGTLGILESLLVSKDVKSLLEVCSSLSDFIRRESLSVIREIADKSSCLALRYEALALRELRSPSNQWLRVSYEEWMTFAEHSLDNGFYSIATKACESALSCFEMNGVNDPQHDDFFRNVEVTGKITRLKDVAVASLASRSGVSCVRAQAADYLKKKLLEMNPSPSLARKEEQFSASTLFRDGIKKRNARKLLDHRRINHITSEPDSNL
ncbi:hypothetical protein RHGRI_036185 [Rhododendron griersonianum]|uniref:Uncharacterized protein n=1 Tax=Rhododendron griersonianum TaxID=479676 RepID=A0AAV6HMK3_9ERIC|nr:hypothetical protein RHGRI_036185 [Rhododendron griersonianum]